MTITHPTPTGTPSSDARDEDPVAFHHGRVSRFNAWFFDTFDPYIGVITRAHKDLAFEDLRPGRIVEIGAGTGANFDRIPSGSKVVAIEPSLAMHDRLRARAGAAGVDIEIMATSATSMPIADDSVDTVVASLVLCTVDAPEQALAEIHRVLRPGGTFRFVEHVAARPFSPRRWLQHGLSRPWAWLFEGCDLHRNTLELIDQAGFSRVDHGRRRFRRSLFVPVNSAVWGIATK